ncbi:small subunit ribosomal protein S2 [Metamycoplasma subdolum]|uniref:Small ribosomal subunit protein uS2 n=1 Tax=Metamycoplasma subdolum TaxID=92407 RepID=A0A3M0AIQ4_9BACT|nr:30S ribosomal protein S2 [Metamycoplasma subdolum]RMA78992.1 small subunit ribosomal protein S2 [Metamycoplasma subdolum]WPB50515.1 30S ribosomal protein S2 [Metamycoplasma subdolum]
MEKTKKEVEVKKTSKHKVEEKPEVKKQEKIQAVPEIISREKLLEAGTYFGHKVAMWNPKMKQYIWGKRMGIHILDVAKTQKALELAYKLLQKMASKPISFIWVGTKKQAKKAIEQAAARTSSAYVSERWLGGTLTNSQTIFRSVRELERLENLQATNYEGYTKKEGLLFDKKIAKLQKNLGGIRKLAGKQTPQVMISASPLDDKIAILEAKKKGLKIIAIQDTNTDPDLVDVIIPANDDSVKSVTLILTVLADAICSAKGQEQLFAYRKNEDIILPEEPKKEYVPKKRYNNNRYEERTVDTHTKEVKKEEVKEGK